MLHLLSSLALKGVVCSVRFRLHMPLSIVTKIMRVTTHRNDGRQCESILDGGVGEAFFYVPWTGRVEPSVTLKGVSRRYAVKCSSWLT